MSNPTSNFGWQMPTATDLVTDLPADFEVFGQAVDTALMDLKGGTTGQVLKKNTNTDMDFVWGSVDGDISGVTAGIGISGGGTSGDVTITNSMATAIDAKGDLIAGTGADTFSRLAIGTNNQILTADSAAATGMKWATPAAPATNKTFSLLSSATASGQTYTVSGLSGYDQIMLVVGGLSANGDWAASLRLNGDSSAIYSTFGFQGVGQGGYSSTIMQNINYQDQADIQLTQSGQAAQNGDVTILISGANSTGVKIVQFACGMGTQVTSYRTNIGMGFYTGSSVISSISLRQMTSTNTWDAGNVRIYGAV